MSMSENLTSRVKRLVSGGFHAMIDAAENLAPEAVMNENIRELDRAIDEVRVELGKTIAQKHLSTKKLAEENNRHEILSEQIQIAVQNQKDDLARAGIAEQIDIEARVLILENTISECAIQERELEDFIAALQATKREMQQNLNHFKLINNQNNHHNQNINNINKLNSIAQNVEKSTQSFERISQHYLNNHINNINNKNNNLRNLQELEELSRNNQIAERLASLKS